jgi:hypothetical protein
MASSWQQKGLCGPIGVIEFAAVSVRLYTLGQEGPFLFGPVVISVVIGIFLSVSPAPIGEIFGVTHSNF